jgi:hypothetical protein
MPFVRASGLWLLALPLLAVVGFWKPYISRFESADGCTHAHALSMSVWCALLVAQPLLLRAGRRAAHRAAGALSYWLVPLMLVSSIALAHHRIAASAGHITAAQSGLLFVQFGTTWLFLQSYALAIVFRRSPALHARFMICTGLTMIDPIVARILVFWTPGVAFLADFVILIVTVPVLIGLIVLERHAPRGRIVFPVMLLMFAAFQAAALRAGDWAFWRRVAEGFARA